MLYGSWILDSIYKLEESLNQGTACVLWVIKPKDLWDFRILKEQNDHLTPHLTPLLMIQTPITHEPAIQLYWDILMAYHMAGTSLGTGVGKGKGREYNREE